MILRAYWKETNEAFPVQNNNKKGEKFRSNLPTGGGGETILELFTVPIFVGSSQNVGAGSFFSHSFLV